MDCRTVAKKSKKLQKKKKNVDNAQQVKEPVHFSNDTILEAVKFLNYEKGSQMRFLCYRFNQLIHSNQSKLQAFEVKSLSMSASGFRRNSIVSFDQGIQPVSAVRKWFQDRGYSCDKTTHIPLEKVFSGMKLFGGDALHFTFQAFFENPRDKNMPLTQRQVKQTGKTRKKSRRLPNAVVVSSEPPKLFSVKFNAEYEFYGPILSHFFRLLYHPAAYFREVAMFPPLTDKFCDTASKNPIRCEQFTLLLESSPEYSLKWLKDNVRAQQITFSFTHYNTFIKSDLRLLVAEFLLQDASICAQDRIKLDLIPEPEEFVNSLVKKYETLEVTKAIPLIVLEFEVHWNQTILESFELKLDPQDNPPLYDKRCDSCNIKTYKRQIKLDGSRKIIAQVRRCFEPDCLYGDSMAYVRFE